MNPTNSQCDSRIRSLNGDQDGENRFYCNDGCKQSCPIFNQKLYPKGFKVASSREVDPLIRKMALERDNYQCQNKECNKTQLGTILVGYLRNYIDLVRVRKVEFRDAEPVREINEYRKTG